MPHHCTVSCWPEQVAEAIQESLEEIKARQDDIQRMKSDLGLGGDTDADAALR